ncbi:MAG: protein-L-isoaspartate O-methyltransferase [Gammaproteobacteria bacterium]|nr:protein-L-isoaspartate O-methyltransferase [Gammaproteobacteria bacterium]
MNRPAALRRDGIGMTSLRTRRRLIARLRAQGIGNRAVLSVLEKTPRHLFIDEGLAHRAYEDTALPIGRNQTISQPFIVALMTEFLLDGDGEKRGGDGGEKRGDGDGGDAKNRGDGDGDGAKNRGRAIKKVLEVGTGCGYQSAVLAQLADWVFTIERIGALQAQAKQLLAELGYRNISFLNADGFDGWQSNQPFDGILVTAAPREVPEKLLAQLAVGGRLVIPVGDSDAQQLRIITRHGSGDGSGDFDQQLRDAVRFVPMLGGRTR